MKTVFAIIHIETNRMLPTVEHMQFLSTAPSFFNFLKIDKKIKLLPRLYSKKSAASTALTHFVHNHNSSMAGVAYSTKDFAVSAVRVQDQVYFELMAKIDKRRLYHKNRKTAVTSKEKIPAVPFEW